ncbi:FAD:protein FMN transferase [Chlamydia pneumoniae]|nr:FAD:protein FMN transferase [Chlamydia pneumoniae]CRI35699.1 FAD:protein FMN transferase [Chlamydia pneumoniae]CRI36826.1 FAD:protein FMN transferase [Chlamydia pneumoniae]CRI37949.1 FAD:protein FMN transferase [Chlamydia pneumoniae]CRI39084.1 FAD:protein FMN transferase [Chlamydia pneumoniae]
MRSNHSSSWRRWSHDCRYAHEQYMAMLPKFFLVLLCLGLCSCSQKTTTIEGEQMTIFYRIVLGTSLSAKEKASLSQQIDRCFHKIDSIYNNWNPYSELSIINRAPADVPITLSVELSEFLDQVDTLYKLSEGRFDPTVGPLKTLWLLHLKSQTLPPKDVWEQHYKDMGWQHLEFQSNTKTLIKKNPHVQIDLCGVVKGYAVDCLNEICNTFCPNNYVEWGGEIKTSGHHPSGRPWRIFSEAAGTILDIDDMAIATSGNHIQKWCVEGKIYTHILDTRTGKPLELSSYPIQSVSVVHPSCAYADAIATVLMTFDSKIEAKQWAEEHHILTYINDGASS